MLRVLTRASGVIFLRACKISECKIGKRERRVAGAAAFSGVTTCTRKVQGEGVQGSLRAVRLQRCLYTDGAARALQLLELHLSRGVGLGAESRLGRSRRRGYRVGVGARIGRRGAGSGGREVR